MNWKFFAMMAAGMMRSAGFAKQAEDENNTGKDDIIGQGLVYAANFIEWLINGAVGTRPAVPDRARTRSGPPRCARNRGCCDGPNRWHPRSPSAHPRQSERSERPRPETSPLLPRTAPPSRHARRAVGLHRQAGQTVHSRRGRRAGRARWRCRLGSSG